jgi:hypothetical protein
LRLLFFRQGLHYVAQVGLECSIFLPQPLECWDDRHSPPQPVRYFDVAEMERGKEEGKIERGRKFIFQNRALLRVKGIGNKNYASTLSYIKIGSSQLGHVDTSERKKADCVGLQVSD